MSDNTIKVEVPAWNLKEAVTEAIAGRVEHIVDEDMAGHVRKAIERRVSLLTDERIKAEVTAVLEKGWPQTDNYGSPTGRNHTVSDVVLKHLQRQDYDRKSTLEKMITDAADNALRGELGKVIAEAKAKLAAMLDNEIQARLAKAVREAFGLKP